MVEVGEVYISKNSDGVHFIDMVTMPVRRFVGKFQLHLEKNTATNPMDPIL
jgi:hypothetical protein